MGLFLQLLLVSTCFAVLHSYPHSSEESTTAGIHPALLSSRKDTSKESDEDKDDVPKRVARNSPPNPKDTTNTPQEDSPTTYKPHQFGSRPVRQAPYPAAGPPPPPCADHKPPPPPPGGHPPPPPPEGHPPPPPPGASRPERDTNHPASNVPQTRPATLPGKIQPKPVGGSPQRNQEKSRQLREASTTTTSPPEDRRQRDTNHPAQNVPKTRPATLPGKIEPQPAQTSQQKTRQSRDVSGSSTSTSTSTSTPQVEGRHERDTNHPAQNVPKTRPAKIEPKPVGGNPQTSQQKTRQSRDVSGSSTSTSTSTPVEGRHERDTNHPAQNVPKTRPATLPAKIDPKPQNPPQKSRQVRDVTSSSTSTSTSTSTTGKFIDELE